MNGVLIIKKPVDFTSRDVVNKVSGILKTKKVGHTGTLDPMATGVLVLCVGNYTKLVSVITADEKEYVATIQFGIETDTLDITGKVLNESDQIPLEGDLKRVLFSRIGKQIQEVPIYSAKKVNGKKLYHYARNNEKVILPKEEIEVKSIELISFSKNIAVIKTCVSKGTYIRSLIRDICRDLGVFGTMSSLERSRQGDFSLFDANTFEDLEKGEYQFMTYETLLQYETHELTEEQYILVNHFNTIEVLSDSLYLLLTYQNERVAFYTKNGMNYKPFLVI